MRRLFAFGLGYSAKALCQRLARVMGGDVRVESELGRGARFTAVVRLRRAQRHTPSSDWLGLLRDLHEIRVLILDEDEQNRELLGVQCRAWGIMPSTARDVREALEHIGLAAGTPQAVQVVIVAVREPVSKCADSPSRVGRW